MRGAQELLELTPLTLGDKLNCAVVVVPHPSGEAHPAGRAHHEIAEADALDVTADHRV